MTTRRIAYDRTRYPGEVRILVLALFVIACGSRKEPAPTAQPPSPAVQPPAPAVQPPAPAAQPPAPAVQPPAPAAQPPAPAAQPPAPAATPPAPTKPRVLPRVSTTCAADADCTITSDELVDHPPNTYACCGGCTQLAVSTVSFKAFQAACEKQPPPMCPPIGCVQPIVRAACEAKHCVVKPASR